MKICVNNRFPTGLLASEFYTWSQCSDENYKMLFIIFEISVNLYGCSGIKLI